MFIETHINDEITLTFLKSANVQAFPCGRRRSALITADVNGDGNITTEEGYHIPFDPEAKLNTEANNRKHSSLNGYTQTYVKGLSDDTLSIALAGYLFNIKAEEGSTYDSIGGSIATALRNFYVATNINDSYESEAEKLAAENALRSTFDTEAKKIYANIRLEDLQLFTGFQQYMTSVLRDQTGDEIPSVYLDLYNNAVNDNDYNNCDNYYFSGLSFSTSPLVSIAGGDGYEPKTRDQLSYTITRDGSVINQQLISLCVLEKVDSVWKIHQPALLPFIEHDVDEDSVVMGETHVRRNLTVDQDATVTNNFTVTDRVEVTSETTKVKNKLVVENDVDVLENKITTKDLESTNVITAKVINTDEETANKATIKNLNADDIQQKVGENYCDVPVIFLKKMDDNYQLQITRVNKLN